MRPVVSHHGLWACEDDAVRVGPWAIPRALSAGPGEQVTVPSSESARYGTCFWLFGWDWRAPPHSWPKGFRLLATALEERGGAALGSAPWEVRSGRSRPRRSAFYCVAVSWVGSQSNMIPARWHSTRGPWSHCLVLCGGWMAHPGCSRSLEQSCQQIGAWKRRTIVV